MLVLRSLFFNLAFYLNLIVWMIVLLPVLLGPRPLFLAIVKAWARSSLRLLEVVAGTKVEIVGRENIPPGGLLVAAKHQSFWETFTLFTVFSEATYILKRDLMWIPLFGWYLAKAGCVPIDRRAGSLALVKMNAEAREAVRKGRQIVIFPEGTRRPAGAPPAYKYGVAHLYENLGVPCVPVGLNSGLYWPRRSFLRRPGTIRIEIGKPIPAGLPRDEFFPQVQAVIEESSGRLLALGRAELGLDAPTTTASA
ncbi:MAG TPA: lysophospholipid acyltransferase family protein [Microvirga sp.]|jgi:1-acyl-sn-glycerol-3-phosphate acyltransferase|nr:lysophospholipid acyltransferase family protein [Microvirga sp.]